MVLAQRKPGGAPAVTAHAINTRTKPLDKSGNVQHLCESMVIYHDSVGINHTILIYKSNSIYGCVTADGIQVPEIGQE